MSQPVSSPAAAGLLAGLRDHLATTFGQKIAVVVPEICEFIEFEAATLRDPAMRVACAHACVALYARRVQIGGAIAEDFATRFDASIDAGGEPLVRARLSPEAHAAEWGADRGAGAAHDAADALRNCALRLQEQSEYELFALTCRIAALSGAERIEDDRNPVHPRAFLRSLLQALGAIDADPGVALAAFRAFGPILLDIVPDTLTSANGWLAVRGVDLDVDSAHGRPLVAPPRPFFPGLVPAASTGELGRVFTSLVQRVISPSEPPANAASVNAVPGLNARAASHGAPGAIPQAGPSAPGQPHAAAVPCSSRDIEVILQETGTDDDRLVAEVIGIMFDQLCVDPRIPAVLKTLVARLQAPVLHVALSDRTFFGNPHHPARRLIDLIAEFGMTLDLGEKDRTTVDSVARVVEDVVRRHATDRAAFKLAHQRLDAMFYHHEESALYADADLRALQETEALECAQQAATGVVDARLEGRNLPANVRAFIHIAWRDVLIRDYLDGGPAGRSWKLGVATLDELLLSVLPASTGAARQRLAKSLPSLIDLIRDGTEHAEVHPRLVEECFADLKRLHDSAVRGGEEAQLPADNAVVARESSASVPAAAGGAIDAPSRPALPVDLPSPSARLHQLGLACGAWIELRHSVVPQRWRLCWITPHKGTCVLKHYESRGRQVFSLEELGDQIITGAAVVLENVGVTSTVLAESFRIMARNARIEELDTRRDPRSRDGLGTARGARESGTGSGGGSIARYWSQYRPI